MCRSLQRLMALLLACALLLVSTSVSEANTADERNTIYKQRMAYYLQMEQFTHIPWYYFAAIDQYERAIQATRKDKKKKEGVLAIQVPDYLWAGMLNPDHQDTNPSSIRFFGGIGKDGDGDGIADPNSDQDLIFTFATYLSSYGFSEEDILQSLWEYYGSDYAVRHIHAFAEIYKKFQTLDLLHFTFPIPKGFHYTYHDTWGHSRGWGGRRMHEGTDIFAGYGTPVLSTCYGYVEVIGWNPYGGWRIGIRDLNNVYHYYAHLSGFNKQIKAGDAVKPGEIIGYVGSSGYGKPGTQGKFPPHLHYGMYKHNGRNEWAFDPYPYLKAWERAGRKQQR